MKKLLAALVTVLFLGLAAFEVYHDVIQRVAWPGYALVANALVFLYAPLWLLAAAAIWIRRDWAWVLLLAGIFTSLLHGVGVLAGGSSVGVLFLGAAPVLLILSWYARRPRPVTALVGDAPRREPATADRR